jgi:hypothetical protein
MAGKLENRWRELCSSGRNDMRTPQKHMVSAASCLLLMAALAQLWRPDKLMTSGQLN